jgi:hypothetical protein
MYSLGWEARGETWAWRRQLRAWEEELLGESQTILFLVPLLVESPDRWKWQSDPVTGYTVREAYQILTSQDAVILGAAEDLLWHKQVPSKVSILVWRLLRDKLPMKTNLVIQKTLCSSFWTKSKYFFIDG